MKNKINSKKSYRPMKVIVETYGKRKTSSISYKRKNTQIRINWIGSRITFCVVGRNPHS